MIHLHNSLPTYTVGFVVLCVCWLNAYSETSPVHVYTCCRVEGSVECRNARSDIGGFSEVMVFGFEMKELLDTFSMFGMRPLPYSTVG